MSRPRISTSVSLRSTSSLRRSLNVRHSLVRSQTHEEHTPRTDSHFFSRPLLLCGSRGGPRRRRARRFVGCPAASAHMASHTTSRQQRGTAPRLHAPRCAAGVCTTARVRRLDRVGTAPVVDCPKRRGRAVSGGIRSRSSGELATRRGHCCDASRGGACARNERQHDVESRVVTVRVSDARGSGGGHDTAWSTGAGAVVAHVRC